MRCLYILLSLLVLFTIAKCEKITLVHRPVSYSGSYNPNLLPNKEKEDIPKYEENYGYIIYCVIAILLIVLYVERRRFANFKTIQQRIVIAKSKDDYAVVKALSPYLSDNSELKNEIAGWLGKHMLYKSEDESKICKQIGYIGENNLYNTNAISKIEEIAEQKYKDVHFPHTLSITHLQEESSITLEDDEDEQKNSLFDTQSFDNIHTQLENMNKINLLSIHQRDVIHQRELLQQKEQLRILTESLQYKHIEKTKRKEMKRIIEERKRMWSSLMVISCVIHFLIPFTMRINFQEHKTVNCLIQPLKMGIFTVIEEPSLCISFPSRLSLGLFFWSAFIFCRFFDIKNLQPIFFICAMWCADLQLVFSVLILQFVSIIILFIIELMWHDKIDHYRLFYVLVTVVSSALSSYFLNSYIYEYTKIFFL